MPPGPELFGPYLVHEQLGVGGMAEVHRAEQAGIEGFRKAVALKRMLPHVAANDEMVKAFVREARLASYLHHVNCAQTYELGKVGDIYFIAMELIEGRNLREVLRACAAIGQIMPVPIALNILNQICDALDYAHNLCDHDGKPLGIIHRDVSPSNIIVAEGGLVKLIDFGIAKAAASDMQTMTGTIKGKFGYMAPEYIEGQLDARADLFAVGVIAHELLTNRPLFTAGDDIETLHRVRDMKILPPSAKNPMVPPEIDDIVMTALERDPEKRWHHATALRTAMTTVTKRLGLEVLNSQVASWLDRTFFDQPTTPFGASAYPTEESVSISISVDSSTDRRATVPINGRFAPAPVPKYERHDALVPSASFLADEVVPTMVRPSAPELVPPPPRSEPPSPAIVLAPAAKAPPAKAAPQPPGKLVPVLLVLLAAAVAATTVYFVLPLLT